MQIPRREISLNGEKLHQTNALDILDIALASYSRCVQDLGKRLILTKRRDDVLKTNIFTDKASYSLVHLYFNTIE